MNRVTPDAPHKGKPKDRKYVLEHDKEQSSEAQALPRRDYGVKHELQLLKAVRNVQQGVGKEEVVCTVEWSHADERECGAMCVCVCVCCAHKQVERTRCPACSSIHRRCRSCEQGRYSTPWSTAPPAKCWWERIRTANTLALCATEQTTTSHACSTRRSKSCVVTEIDGECHPQAPACSVHTSQSVIMSHSGRLPSTAQLTHLAPTTMALNDRFGIVFGLIVRLTTSFRLQPALTLQHMPTATITPHDLQAVATNMYNCPQHNIPA